MIDLAPIRQQVDRKLAAYNHAVEQHRREKLALAEASGRVGYAREALSIAQEVAQKVQEQAHRKIADIVTTALAAIFEEDAYTFKVVFEQKRGRTEAVLLFERNGVEVDPMTAAGGGVVDVAGMALRISCLLMQQPPLCRVLVLDEPFRHLSKNYTAKARELLLRLAKDLKTQLIVITHDRNLAAGTIVEL